MNHKSLPESAGPGLRQGQLRVVDIWALGVGIVVCGQYFGWNIGLKNNGPMAMMLASLIVCLLFLAWVLALAELSVAMPRAGGPLEFGKRASGPWLGFLMAWSMFLACQFGAIATALASGGYIAFILNAEAPDSTVSMVAGLVTVVIIYLLQVWGVKEQSAVLLAMNGIALAVLVLFWCVAATNFSWDRVWTTPIFHTSAEGESKGWQTVMDAIPFALWWLIVIEAVALAAEETHQPERTIPRGLTYAILTIIFLVVMTILFSCGALHYNAIAEKDGREISYPLPEIIRSIPAGQSRLLLLGFSIIALFGLVTSYHALIYSSSRQIYALGRDGYLPAILGEVHARRGTPVPAILGTSLVSAGFVIANLWYEDAIKVAVLVAGLVSLLWYIMAMGCLVRLRRREPGIFRKYRAPLPWLLPILVVLISIVALITYPSIDAHVVPLTVVLYAVGAGYYCLYARHKVSRDSKWVVNRVHSISLRKPTSWLDRLTTGLLIAVLFAVGWIVGVSYYPTLAGFASAESQMWFLLGLVTVAILSLSVVALTHTGHDTTQAKESEAVDVNN